MIISGLKSLLKGYSQARYFFTGWLYSFFSIVIILLVRFGLLTSNTMTDLSYPLGMIVLIVFLSFALADRINIMKLETENALFDLQQERDFNREIFDTTPAFAIGIDNEGRITLINETMLRTLGYNREDVVGNVFVDIFIQENEKEKIADILSNINGRNPEIKNEYYIIAKDGTRRLIEWHTSTVYDKEKETNIIFKIGLDITDQRKLEEQLIQSQKMETIGTLAGGIAHDFNNILAGIIGPLGILEKNLKNNIIDSDKLKKYLSIMKKSAERAASIVKQLLSLSRKQELSFKYIDLNISVKHVLEICQNTLDKSIKISFSNPDNPAIILADPTQIEQIILNLCVNAGHAMTFMRQENEEWGGSLIISIEEFFADKYFYNLHPEANEDNYWLLAIKDTGIGMDSSTQSQIFNPFFTTKEKGEGTGLGLSMVYNIIKEHKGFIDVYSEVGTGSTFNIFLPASKKDATDANNKSEINFPTGRGMILVIDDEEAIRLTTKEMLSDCGYDAILAPNGLEAVSIFKKSYNEIKLVILDLSMPIMSGKETYIKLKEINQNVKVLLASGFLRDDRVENLMQLGVNSFIQKPYTLQKLTREVHRLIYEK